MFFSEIFDEQEGLVGLRVSSKVRALRCAFKTLDSGVFMGHSTVARQNEGQSLAKREGQVLPSVMVVGPALSWHSKRKAA